MEDDDMPTLSAHALLALNEFLAERSSAQKAAQDVVPEDWQLSQFWYTDEAATTLAEEALEQAGPRGRIACLSTPSAFKALKRVIEERGLNEVEVLLFEYDRRFEIAHPDQFLFYDYNRPTTFGDSGLSNSEKYQASFDVVLIDPPHLGPECMSFYFTTYRFLAKPTTRLLIVTGRITEDYILGQEADSVGGTMRVCQWQPSHSNKLSNEFWCYTNYASSRLNPEPAGA